MASTYSLESPFALAVHGEGKDWEPILRYFGSELGVGVVGGHTISLVCSGDIDHSPDQLYGVSGGMTSAGRFVIPDGAGHWCALDPGELRVSPDLNLTLDLCCPRFKPTVLLDWVVLPCAQFAAASIGWTPLHASAATWPGRRGPVILSAWSGVGKTNLVLHALQSGGDYFGDDRVFVSRSASVRPSSRRVSIYGYNRKLAPQLPQATRLKLAAGDHLHRAARGTRGRVAYLLAYAANGLASSRMDAEALGGRRGEEGDAAAHVLCTASAEIHPQSQPALVSLSEVDALGLARSHVAVMEYEFIWFRRYLQTWLWATRGRSDPWEALIATWTGNLVHYFQQLPQVLTLTLPQGSPASVAPKAWQLILGALDD